MSQQQQQIGRRLSKNPSTIIPWLQKYRMGELEALLQVKKTLGAERKLNDEVLQALQQRLTNEEGAVVVGSFVQWLLQEHGLTVEYGTVH